MPSRAVILLFMAVSFMFIGAVIFLLGASLPFPPLISLIAGFACFIVTVFATICALYFYQREAAS